MQLQEEIPDLESLRETALAQRPQLLALQNIVARNEKALELAQKNYYPDLDVRLSYGQRDSMLDGGKRPDMVTLTMAVNLPVWRESKLAPRVAEAVALREQASSLYQAQTASRWADASDCSACHRRTVEERAVLHAEQQPDAARRRLRAELAAARGFLVDEFEDLAEQLRTRVALREPERHRSTGAPVDLGHPVHFGRVPS